MTVFEYDGALRLTLERRLDDAGLVLSERSYSYDVDGNRLTRSTVSGGLPAVETYSYGPGFRLASIDDGSGPQTYGHDAGGRVNAFDGNTIAYDSLDHVTSVFSGSASYSYTFDGEGRRVASTDGTLSREFLVVPNMVSAGAYESPMLVTDAGGSAVRSYVYAGEHAVMRVQDTGAGVEPTYYLRDAMGSVALADSTGTRTARFEYDAFGEVDSATGADASLPAEGDFRHHGMWLDPTGLYYVRSRSYDANTGRFLTRDPVDPGMGVPEAWSPYVANLSNPLVYRDPEGLFTLIGFSVSVNIEGSGNIVQTFTAQQVREHIVDELGNVVGQLIMSAIEQALPTSLTSIIPSNLDSGDILGFNLCAFLPPSVSTALGGLHLEVQVGGSGRPLSEGYNCSVGGPDSAAALAGITQALGTGRRTRPDFIYAPAAMSEVAAERAKSWIIGDFKHDLGNWLQKPRTRRQLATMTTHAARFGYRVVGMLSFRHVTQSVEQRIAASGVARGVLILVASP